MIASQLLTTILAAISMFFLAMVIYGVLANGFTKYQEHYMTKNVADMSDMFFFIDPQQMLVLTLALCGAFFVIGFLMSGIVIGLIMGLIGLAAPSFLVKYYKRKRIKDFERQLVDALGAMSNAFRAGLTFRQALEEIAKTADAPLSQEFSLTVREVRMGMAIEEALENMAKRVKSEDLDLVVTSVVIAKNLGGNMAEMFETIAATIRERFRIQGKIESLTAQGKLQGIVIGLMPILVWVGFDYVRPDMTRPMMNHWFGYVIVGLVVVMEIMGAWLIKKIVTIEV